MDPRERMEDPLVAARAMLRGWQADIWTALPAKVQSYDAAKMTVEVQPTIQAQVRSPEGKQPWSNVTLPVCVDCPVQFPSGGGFVLTFPIAVGDEGIVIFSSRCIDAWWQNGGVQPQAELRLHDLSDGMFIPGLFSQPRVVTPSPSTSAAQLRSADGQTVVEVDDGQLMLSADGGTSGLKVVPGGVQVTGYLSVSGNFQLGGLIKSFLGATYTGALQFAGEVFAKFGLAGQQVGLSTHRHGTGTAAAGTVAPTGGT